MMLKKIDFRGKYERSTGKPRTNVDRKSWKIESNCKNRHTFRSKLAQMWAISCKHISFSLARFWWKAMKEEIRSQGLSSFRPLLSRSERWVELLLLPYKGLYSFTYWAFGIFLLLYITFCTLHVDISTLYMTRPFDGFPNKIIFCKNSNLQILGFINIYISINLKTFSC